jgi:hypothetical protein
MRNDSVRRIWRIVHAGIGGKRFRPVIRPMLRELPRLRLLVPGDGLIDRNRLSAGIAPKLQPVLTGAKV